MANGLHLVQIRSNRRRARHWSQRARLAFADSLDGWCEVGPVIYQIRECACQFGLVSSDPSFVSHAALKNRSEA